MTNPHTLPTTADVRAALRRLSAAELTRLSAHSGVPLSTLSKIRSAHTLNPGVETVGAFWPLLTGLPAPVVMPPRPQAHGAASA